MSNDNFPFSGPFAPGGQFGGNPINDPGNGVPKCPKCKSQEFSVISNQYGILRTCSSCGNQWSGGTMACGIPTGEPIPMPSIPVPDDPDVIQYTGASFRDPSKTFGEDDDF